MHGLTNLKTKDSIFYVIHTVHFLIFHIFKTHQKALIKYNKADQKIHFISGANSYMFRHQDAIIREFINNKGL